MENVPQKSNLSRIWRSLGELLLLFILIVVFFQIGGGKIVEDNFRQIAQKRGFRQEEPKLPLPDGSKEIDFQWKYNGKDYTITEILYASYYDFYAAKPKTYQYFEDSLPQNWEEKYFEMFLQYPAEERTIPELALKIKAAGLEKKLTEDQIVELVLAFVQSIPYDEVKAQKILSESQSENPDNAPDYPYEVLYDNTGVCSDKSLLTYALIKELGYGAAFFIYDTANHMSVGIKCPIGQSTYGSGYCYAETTATGNKIGIIPELDSTNNKATAAKELAYFDENDANQSNLTIAGEAKILNITDGKTYTGIIQTFKTQKAIADLGNFITSERLALKNLKIKMSEAMKEIDDLKKKMNRLLDKESVEEYNDLVPKYNKLVSAYQKDVKNYNSRIKIYNQKVNEYNKLIKSFYQI